MKPINKIINNLTIIIGLLCVAFILIFFFKPEDHIRFDKSELEYYKVYYFEKGEAAMLKYLRETNQLKDSTIDINPQKLKKIENKFLNKKIQKNDTRR